MTPALLLIGVVLVLRWAYLAFLCPFALVEDEAHYWEWSRFLDWSYYTKGPGIAFSIAATTRVFGDTEFGVRALAPVYSAVAAIAAGLLVARLLAPADQAPGRGPVPARAAILIAVASLMLAPAFQVTALLSTIDGPYCACWSIACLCAHAALMRRSRFAWPALGLALGVGFLFKYTILLLLPGLLIFAWRRRRELALCRRPLWPALGCVIAFTLSAAPVAIWNQRHGWPTVRHLLGHLGVVERSALSEPATATVSLGERLMRAPLNVAEFAGTQLGIIGPLLVLALVAMWNHSRRRATGSACAPPTARSFLIWCGAPILVFYLLVSFVAEPEGNWPIAAYLTLLPLAGLTAASALHEVRTKTVAWLAIDPNKRPHAGFLRKRPESLAQVLFHAGVAVGVVAAVITLALGVVAPVIGGSGPLARLSQGRDMATAFAPLRTALKGRTGRDPLVFAQHYGRASQLAFYLADHPKVFCTSSRQAGRPTAQDFWTGYDMNDPALRGQNAAIVGGSMQEWTAVFEQVEPLGLLPGVARKGVHAFYGLGFKGFAIRPSQESTLLPPASP